MASPFGQGREDLAQFVLHFKNTQRNRSPCPIHRLLIKATPVLESFVGEEVVAPSVEMHGILCGKKKMRRLNQKYRGRDKATDVLSFPVHENARKLLSWEGPLNLGDVFVCREVALRQARESSQSFEREALRLFVHGLGHLLGYDHERSYKEACVMRDREETLLRAIVARVGGLLK